MRKLIFTLIFVFLSAVRCPLNAEEVTITTYYPAPEGVYKDLWAEEYYGYPETQVPGLPAGISYGLDPVNASTSTDIDGSFLKQLYIGSGLDTWDLDERAALYVRNPSSADWNSSIYSGARGDNSFGVVSIIESGTGSTALYGENYADGVSYGVKGLTNSGTDGGVGVYGGSTTDLGIGVYAKAFDNDSRALIVEQGNVGIGTTNPQHSLHIYAGQTNPFKVQSSTGGSGNSAGILFNTFNTITSANARIAAIDAGSYNGHLAFYTDGDDINNANVQERMRITSGGNVGIGTTNIIARLDVRSNDPTNLTAIRGEFTDSVTNGVGITGISHTSGYGGNYGVYGRIEGGGGNVGAGVCGESTEDKYGVYGKSNTGIAVMGMNSTTSPTGYAAVNGTNNSGGPGVRGHGNSGRGVMGTTFSGTAIYGERYTSGFAGYFVGPTWCSDNRWSGSDLRLKKNIEKLSNVIKKLENINGVKFNWRSDEFPNKGLGKERQIGIIAQDVEKEFPELVTADNEGYKALAYDRFTAVLLEAIKEQQKQIEELNKKVAALEKISK